MWVTEAWETIWCVCVCARALIPFVSMCDYSYNHEQWTSVNMSSKSLNVEIGAD